MEIQLATTPSPYFDTTKQNDTMTNNGMGLFTPRPLRLTSLHLKAPSDGISCETIVKNCTKLTHYVHKDPRVYDNDSINTGGNEESHATNMSALDAAKILSSDLASS